MKRILEQSFYCLLCLIFCALASTADAQQFIVRTVYFQPTDAPEPSNSQIVRLLIESQDFYRDEMDRHGYGTKTFKLETTPDGYVGFHHIRGKHKSDYYHTDTFNRVKPELPSYLAHHPATQDNALVLIVGGLDTLDNGVGGIAYAWQFAGNRTGGIALISGNDLFFRLIAHEIGHTFGLHHTDVEGAMMGAWADFLLDYEARWLDRHHFFNDTHIRTDIPRFIEIKPPQAIGQDVVRFNIVAESKSGLYQAQMMRVRDRIIIGTAEAEGEKATISIDVEREYIVNYDDAIVQIMDIHGNQWITSIDKIILPLPVIVDINADGVVNIQDLILVASRLGEMWEGAEDVNRDGVVNIQDLVLVASQLGEPLN